MQLNLQSPIMAWRTAHFSKCPHHKVIVQVFIMLHGTGAPPP